MEYSHSLLIMLLQFCNWIIIHSEHQEVCDRNEFVVTCADNEAILAEKAIFGRMRLGKCVHKDFGYLGCENNVLELVDKWCSGLKHCLVEVTNDDLDRANTACAADLNSYLDVDYTCVPVIQPGRVCSSRSPLVISNNQGHISSQVTSQTGCGSPKAPWVIQAQPGQTVHLWLIDFGALNRQRQSLYTSCHQLYGFIIERDLGVNLTMCGGTERKTEIYKSKTNKVEIHMLSRGMESPRCLVQFSLVGCADLTPPAHAWYKRDGDEAIIGCKSNNKVWHLNCKENTWNGVVGNCTKAGFTDKGTANRFDISFSTVITLTSVVCGAVLLVIIVIVAGVVYVRKQSIRHEIKLRSDYGPTSDCMYYTLRAGYDAGMCARDTQTLVRLADKVTVDRTSQSGATNKKVIVPFETHHLITEQGAARAGNLM